MASISSINILFRADLKQFSSEIQNASREMKKYGNNLQSIGNTLSIGLTLPIVAAGAASIKMASDYNESLNKVDVAFKSSSAQVKEFAKDSLESFGIAEGTALDMAATFGDMATSMGLSTGAAAKMSTSLTGLAGDLASFKNIGIDEATTALNGVFTGETESLKRLGIVMTEANLQTFALSKGIKTQVKDMDQASKVNLRYAYIMANTTNAQGDFVRTGGGAANQMRIFQESLKQVGQQFGAVILPAFTKLITYVNSMIKGFGELSPATRETIVIIAGVAAAIGPLLTGVGKLLTFLPNLALAVKSVGASFTQLQAFAVANPYLALAAVIGAIAGGLYLWYSNQKEVISSQQALNNAIAEGNKNASAEVATLDTLYKTATNVKLSINERKKAVDELQSLYPAYFKNLKDEAILNGTASASYKQLRDDIFNKARAIAVDNEIQKRANDRVIEETALREKILETEKGIQRIRKGADVVVLQEASAIEKTAKVTATKTDLLTAQYKLLKIQRGELAKFNASALSEDEALLKAKQDFGAKSSKLAQNEIDLQGQIVVGTDAITAANERQIKSSTIEFYEAQISELQKLQKIQATTNTAWLEYQNNIDAIQKKIDALTSTKVNLPKPQIDMTDPVAPPAFSIGNLEEQKAYYEKLRTQFSTTADEYAKYTDLINNTELKIKAISGIEEAKLQVDSLTESQKYLLEVGQAVGQGVGDAFSQLSTGLIEQLGLAKTGFDGFVTGLVQTVTKLVSMMLASSISQSIAGATASGTATGPGAIFTTPAFIATAVGGVLAAFASIPKFENGGMVGGTSTFGDKLFARVNSGEMILNKSQQRNLSSMINSASTVDSQVVVLGGGFDIEGTKLRLVLDRTDNKKKRQG